MNYIEVKLKIDPTVIARDIVVAELGEIGFESFVESEHGVDAYIQEPFFDEELMKNLSAFNHTDFKVNYVKTLIEDQNWNEVWEQSFEPINVNDTCMVRAPFHEVPKNIEFDIIIEPKMSFGTGHHETTFLMIQELLKMDLNNKKVLDMGCGTGVLAILAEQKNADKILAVDIDDWAYENTLDNLVKNKCSKIEVLKGGAECIQDKKFDIIIANINRNILLQDLKNYANSLNNNGHLLLSGFFSSDAAILIETANKYGLTLIDQHSKNDWTLLHLTN
ncbi:MAG: 50S ribosomal protein L11 methyltransferase [Flavobacteriales bacterium]|nr:50S ribosomal protein L11 methyltransferase [Flavobacteriales bacterium]